MSTTLHSFVDIFDTEFTDGSETVKLQKIIIPIIQRDYAQGRLDPEINRVRSRFLESLYNAVETTPVTLDFVYGDLDSEGVMTPLDGQQRLTTLFLLHWYAAKKESIEPKESAFLKNFGYETRYSARNFCNDLTSFSPSFTAVISEEIIDQPWFPLEWKKDPTISSMLVMIDAIHDRFSNVKNLWEKLKGGAITFYFLPIKDMGLTDELYIKMNSRGKPLTRFEHFKAELERTLQKVDDETAKRIIGKIDLDWTDLFWNYRDSGMGIAEDVITDDEFLKYFRFICDIICYRGGESPLGKSSDEFDMLQMWFSGDKEYVMDNISTLESYFDCWCHLDGYDNPSAFLASFMSHEHEHGKIIVENRYKIDIFEDCLHSYADKSGRTRLFPLGRIVLLYAIICYLRNKNTVTESEFARRLRIVNNLIQNSEDEVSDRIDRNRIPAILQQTDAIITKGEIDDSIENSFNVNQLNEEKEKMLYLKNHPEKEDMVFMLEDHQNLRGQISIIGLDHLEYGDRFRSLFACNWDRIDCALMSVGNYGQQERNRWRYQYGSKGMQIAWDQLFHKSANNGFENTKRILLKLLSVSDSFSDDLLSEIATQFVSSCEEAKEYPWRYYYIKYSSYRPGSYGKLSNSKVDENPYMYSVLQTKSQWSENSYLPYLKEADPVHLSRDSMGQRLAYDDLYIIGENNRFIVKDSSTDEDIETVPIKQNERGIDVEDRINVLKEYIKTNF